MDVSNVNYVVIIVLITPDYVRKTVEALRTEKIVGGSIITAGWFKFVVAVMYKSEGKPDENPCSGSIIDDWHIITVAHCFYDKQLGTYRNKYFYIVVAATNLNEPTMATRYIEIDFVIMPALYESTPVDTYFTKGDLAIVKLKYDLDLHNNEDIVRRLNIPQQRSRNLDKSFSVAGYGWNEINLVTGELHDNAGTIQTGRSDGRMRFAKAKILKKIYCRNMIGDNLADGNICAKTTRIYRSRAVGVCQNDSGSPLTSNRYLNGIVINGFMECDDERMPGIYIDVLHYKDFIARALRGNRSEDMRVIQLQNSITANEFIFVEI